MFPNTEQIQAKEKRRAEARARFHNILTLKGRDLLSIREGLRDLGIADGSLVRQLHRGYVRPVTFYRYSPAN